MKHKPLSLIVPFSTIVLITISLFIFTSAAALAITPTQPSNSTGVSGALTSYPTTPPIQVCGNSDILGSGPTVPPPGAIIVPAGDNSSMFFTFREPNRIFWFAPGVHTVGNPEFSGYTIPWRTTFLQGNVFRNNRYFGDWRFAGFHSTKPDGTRVTWQEWTTPAPPVPTVYTHDNRPATFGQDAGSTYTALPTASVQVGGRVVTSNGRGIYRARITITDPQGNIRTTLTNPWGHYRFVNIPAGHTYTFFVSHKSYRFAQPTRILAVNEAQANINFTALP